MPTLLGQPPISLLGYPLPMVLAEKIVTAIERGTANTRWRDFADVWTLTRRQEVGGDVLGAALRVVAAHRGATLEPLLPALDGYPGMAQARWAAWRRRQNLPVPVPEQFADVLEDVAGFADAPLTGAADGLRWDPAAARWS